MKMGKKKSGMGFKSSKRSSNNGSSIMGSLFSLASSMKSSLPSSKNIESAPKRM